MKINNECARRIMLEVEKIPFGETMSVVKLHETIGEYSIEEVLAIVTLFNREHYLNVCDKVSYDDNDVLRDNKIKCLSEKGYRTLDLIRDDESWHLIKKSLPNFNDISIYTLFDIANRIKIKKYNEIFQLPNDLVVSNVGRW